MTKTEALRYAFALDVLNLVATVEADEADIIGTMIGDIEDEVEVDEIEPIVSEIADVLNLINEDTLTDDVIDELAEKYAVNDLVADEVEADVAMVARKAGYERKLVVRNGQKKWVNKRKKGVHIRLTPKQKMALLKARMKAHTGKANLNRKKSSRYRKRFGLK